MSDSKKQTPSLNDIVSLNVGGQTFMTSRSTLVSEPDSLLSRMFGPDSSSNRRGIDPARKDREGAYFIDRSPEAFRVILEYLRTKKLFKYPGLDQDRIAEEAEYFGLDSLLDRLHLSDLPPTPEPPPPKRVMVYSLKQLRVTGCATVRHDDPDGYSSKTARTATGQLVCDVPFERLQARNVFFEDRLEETGKMTRLEVQVKTLQLAKVLLDQFDNYFIES